MNNRDRIFGLLAVLAVAIYMFACGSRPAWSPDSNRVVFSFADQDGDTTGLAVYDLRTKQVSRIYETDEQIMFQPLWLGESEQIVALAVVGEKRLQIIRIDLSSSQSQIVSSISAKEALVALMIPPVLVDDRYVFFSAKLQEQERESEVSLCRFDLKTQKLKVVPKGIEHYLFSFGSEYIYIASSDKGGQVGMFDPKSMRFKRMFSLDADKYGHMTAGVAVKKEGKEFVMVTGRDGPPESKMFDVIILNQRGKILKKIPLPEAHGFEGALHIAYEPEQRSLWIPSSVPIEKDGKVESEAYIFSLLELDIETGKYFEVLSQHVSGRKEMFPMQPSISPDGKYLAVNILSPTDQQGTLLYLVDLTTPRRTVTKVSLPARLQPITTPQEQ